MLEQYKSFNGCSWGSGDRYLTMRELRAKLGGRSRSAIYLDLEEGRLPPPIKLGGRLYWVENEVDAHLRSLAEAQRDQRNAEGDGIRPAADISSTTRIPFGALRRSDDVAVAKNKKSDNWQPIGELGNKVFNDVSEKRQKKTGGD